MPVPPVMLLLRVTVEPSHTVTPPPEVVTDGSATTVTKPAADTAVPQPEAVWVMDTL